MRRGQFIVGLASAAVAWPTLARAQQCERVRRVGWLVSADKNDPLVKTGVSAFTQAFADLGWTDRQNVRMDFRWAGGDTNRMQAFAKELVSLQPDIILADATPPTIAFQRETKTIPIVFAGVGDPIASGIVAAFNEPGGNITGFGLYEASLGGKCLQLLSEIAPGMFNPDNPATSFFCPHLRRRPAHSRSCQSLRPFIATQRSRNYSMPATRLTQFGRDCAAIGLAGEIQAHGRLAFPVAPG